jgi:hypothetical protein
MFYVSLVKVTYGGTDLDTHCDVPTEPLYAKICNYTKLGRPLEYKKIQIQLSDKNHCYL